MSTYSQSHREYYLRNRERILSTRLERERRWMVTPKGQYSAQKRKAKQRKIEWQFDFDSWWKVWQDSGKWEERGDERGRYCMSRRGDTGPYSVDNVYINLFEENSKESALQHGFQKR